jgi:hypothetical protein
MEGNNPGFCTQRPLVHKRNKTFWSNSVVAIFLIPTTEFLQNSESSLFAGIVKPEINYEGFDH